MSKNPVKLDIHFFSVLCTMRLTRHTCESTVRESSKVSDPSDINSSSVRVFLSPVVNVHSRYQYWPSMIGLRSVSGCV